MVNLSIRARVSSLPRTSTEMPSLGELLVVAGRLSVADAERVALMQRQRGIPFGEAAQEMGLVSATDVRAALARQFDYPVLDSGDQGVAPELVAAFEPDSPRAEALRKLRSQLVLRRIKQPALRCVAIVGAARGEGRSWLAANLAVAFSQLGEPILLIDGDMRTPRQQSLFRLAPGYGLAARLAERGDGAAPAPHAQFPHLTVLQAGFVPPNPQELLARPAFAAQLVEARATYAMTLVDTPADALGADGQMIAAAAGAAIIVARRHAASQKRVAALAADLAEAGVTVVGGVLLDF